jgi:hypothetical protein
MPRVGIVCDISLTGTLFRIPHWEELLRDLNSRGNLALLFLSQTLLGLLVGAGAVGGGGSVILDGAARVVAEASPLRCPEERCMSNSRDWVCRWVLARKDCV